MLRVYAIVALALAATQAANPQSTVSIRAGLLNYAEGRIETTDGVAGKPQAGVYHLRKGEQLRTRNGRAELLLAPCVFLRLADGSQIEMLNDTLGQAEISLLQGTAVIEAVDIPKGEQIRIHLGTAVAELRQPGIYRLDANSGRLRVFEGKAAMTRDGLSTVVKKGKMLDAAARAPVEFDRKAIDRTQRWSARRALAVAQSNLILAKVNYGPSWRRVARVWIWSVYLNAEAARASIAPAPAVTG